MRIAVLGGGPGGLYCALLLKKSSPAREITVFERNPPDATYGWGVVFSQQTLTALEEADAPSYQRIVESFVHWEDIDVHYREAVLRSGGHSFSGISRTRLLEILQRRCLRLGVELRFQEELAHLDRLQEHDLVVAADGVNSLARRTHPEAFRPSTREGRARYIWYGVERLFPAFTFIFRHSEHGLFQAHAYPFDRQLGLSTFIVECSGATCQRAGLERAGEEESIAYCSELFAPQLHGKRLLSNRSQWIRFLTVRNQRWHHGNLVLLGDAAHTAHFSIGSGTRMAMEDAIALARALERHAELQPAFLDYELERRPAVERLQLLALQSQEYFESVSAYTHLEPPQFAFNLLTRSGRISYENLRQRDPRFVHQLTRWYLRRSLQGRDGRAVYLRPLQAPLRLAGVELPNRVVAPMAPRRTAGPADGRSGPWELVTAGSLALSGVGLILSPLLAVDAGDRPLGGAVSLHEDSQVPGWQEVVGFVHRAGAGRMAARIGWGGSERGPPLSGVRRQDPPQVHTLSLEELQRLKEAFAAAARRAAEAGFDLLEVDMAGGGLLHAFLSPLSNRREDGYGGSLEGRLRFPQEVWEAVRSAWPTGRPLAARLPGSDWLPGGLQVEEALTMAEALAQSGADLFHVSAGELYPAASPAASRPTVVELADRVRSAVRIPVLCGSVLLSPDEADTLLAAGRADLVRLDPRRPLQPAAGGR